MRRGDRQLELEFSTWGGRRDGAGRKRAPGRRPNVPHRARAEHKARHPVHVTLRARAGLPPFRENALFGAMLEGIRRASRSPAVGDAFRVVHFSVQRDHVHLIIEAAGRDALIRGVQGLSIRLARVVNRARGLPGQVWGDRYHSRALKTPREVRNAIVYVLMNASRCTSRASRFTGTLSKPRMSVALFRRARRTRRELTPDKSSSAVSLSSSLYLDLRYCSCLPKHT